MLTSSQRDDKGIQAMLWIYGFIALMVIGIAYYSLYPPINIDKIRRTCRRTGL